MADELLDIPTVAARLKISRMTVYRLIHAHAITATNIALGAQRTKLRIRESAYEAFMKAREV
jgi:excisionase family DNA binding protein